MTYTKSEGNEVLIRTDKEGRETKFIIADLPKRLETLEKQKQTNLDNIERQKKSVVERYDPMIKEIEDAIKNI